MFYTKEDFIAAMRANPDDVVLMAAFSDWLEEHDDPMWEGMRLLAEYGIVGGVHGYHNIIIFRSGNNHAIGPTWWDLDWDIGHVVNERIRLCNAFYLCNDETKAKIRRELAELYPHSDATLAARSRSLPA